MAIKYAGTTEEDILTIGSNIGAVVDGGEGNDTVKITADQSGNVDANQDDTANIILEAGVSIASATTSFGTQIITLSNGAEIKANAGATFTIGTYTLNMDDLNSLVKDGVYVVTGDELNPVDFYNEKLAEYNQALATAESASEETMTVESAAASLEAAQAVVTAANELVSAASNTSSEDDDTVANDALNAANALVDTANAAVADAPDVEAYNAALEIYNTALATATASQEAANTAALTVDTVELANASLEAATQAQTDAQALIDAVNAVVTAAENTDSTEDDADAQTALTSANDTLASANALVDTANAAVIDAPDVEIYNAALEVYNTALATATASQEAANTAAEDMSTQELATTAKEAATTALTDAQAVVTAIAAVVTAAENTDSTEDDEFAATAQTDALAAQETATTSVATADDALSQFVNIPTNTSADETLAGTDGVDNFTYDYSSDAIVNDDDVEIAAAGAGEDGTDTITGFAIGTDKLTFNDISGAVTDQAGFEGVSSISVQNSGADLNFYFEGNSTGNDSPILTIKNFLQDADDAGFTQVEDGIDTLAEVIEVVGVDNISFTDTTVA